MRLRAIALVLLGACWTSTKPAPEPIANTDTGSGSAVAPVTTEAARTIQRTADGGVIELAGNDRGLSLDQANIEMDKHCGTNLYTITQEGEEAIDGGKVAWRVHYSCLK